MVEARRELLVLTAQLHAAIESVDQASLQAASETASGADEHGHAATDVLTGQRSLGATEDLVLGARREVRSVLDEARAEIEALAAEAHRPLREIPAALSASPPSAEAPIPTLETILGANPLAPRTTGPARTQAEPGPAPIDSVSPPDRDDDDDGGGGNPPRPWHHAPESRLAGPSTSATLLMNAPVATVAPAARVPGIDFGSFETSEDTEVEPLSTFGETGPIRVMEPGRTFLAEYRGRPGHPPRLDVGWPVRGDGHRGDCRHRLVVYAAGFGHRPGHVDHRAK